MEGLDGGQGCVWAQEEWGQMLGTDSGDESTVGLTGTRTSSANRQLQVLTFPTSEQERRGWKFQEASFYL